MKSRLLAILMAVTMVFAMAPLTAEIAFADDEIAADATGDTVLAEIAAESSGELPEGCIFKIGAKNVTKTSDKGKGWTFKYESGTGYLTLNNAKIKTASPNWNYDFGILADGMDLQITLKGKNYISGAAIPYYDSDYIAIDCEQKLTITGKGSLSISNSYCGIYSGEDLSIKAKKVTASGEYYGIFAGGPTTISKSKVTANGNDCSLEINDFLAIRKSTVTVTGKKYGIYSQNSMEVSNSTVKSNVGSGKGITVSDQIVVINSKVTASSSNEAAIESSLPMAVMNSKVTASSIEGYGLNVYDLTVQDSQLLGKGHAAGIYVEEELSLIKTAKGKYVTRVDGEATGNVSGSECHGIDVGWFTCDGFRVLTPEGGKIYQPDTGYVVDKDGVPALHAVIVPKKVNPLKIKGKTATVKYSLLKAEDQTLAVGKVIKFVKAGKGIRTFTKVSGNYMILVDEATGALTVQAGLAKGTYKVKIEVTAAGDDTYLEKSKTVTVKVRVK